jgi:hypothetical protein
MMLRIGSALKSARRISQGARGAACSAAVDFIYLHADMRLKEKALARTAPLGVNQAKYRPCDKLLSFFEGL